MYLESTTHVEATPVAKHELTALAEAIAILIELRDANKSQTDGTERAVSQLGRFLDDVYNRKRIHSSPGPLTRSDSAA